jgi:hypothetical protein
MKWSYKSNEYNQTENATISRLERSSLCGSPANDKGWSDLGQINTAAFAIDPLQYKNISTSTGPLYVYYMFGDAASNDWSQEFRFRVPPPPGNRPHDRPTTVILYDDLGRGSLDQSYTWYILYT